MNSKATIRKYPTSVYSYQSISGGVQFTAIRFTSSLNDPLGLNQANKERVAEMYELAESMGCECTITKYGSITINVRSEKTFLLLQSQFSDVIDTDEYTPARLLDKYDESVGLGKSGSMKFYDLGEKNESK